MIMFRLYKASKFTKLENVVVVDVYGGRQRRDDISLQCDEKSTFAERDEHVSSSSRLHVHSSVSVVSLFSYSHSSSVKDT